MVVYGSVWYCMEMNGTLWYVGYYMLNPGTVWYSIIIYGKKNYKVVWCGTAWYLMGVNITTYYCVVLYIS